MPSIGDRVRFESTKVAQAHRDGVVTGVDGELLHIEWSTGGESSLVPGAGSITIVGKVSGETAARRTDQKAGEGHEEGREEVGPNQEADPSPKGREEGCEEAGSSSEASCPESG